jgi:hypothetical protein
MAFEPTGSPIDFGFVLTQAMQTMNQHQSKFMFLVQIPYIPVTAVPMPYFEFMVKATDIPSKKRESYVVRMGDGNEFTVPEGSGYEHTWSVTILMNEVIQNDMIMNAWFKAIDLVPTRSIKAVAYVTLMTLAKIPTRVITLTGIYPKHSVPIEGLSQDEENGYVTYEMEFAFDDIIYGGIPL